MIKMRLKSILSIAKKTPNILKSYKLIMWTFIRGECYFGPFVGEFGHLLSHIIPFLSYLYSKGIKIHYCGPEIHKPYFIDNDGNSILKSFVSLRDFYSEFTPTCNDQLYPDDVKEVIENFVNYAYNSKLPFWDIRTRDFYWEVFCKWEYLNRFVLVYKRKKISSSLKSVVVFARKKGEYSEYRGDDWDFQEIIDEIKNFTSKVYVLGHPAFSHNIKESENVEVLLTSDNSIITDKCSKADLIITQLSGTHYLGVYFDTRVILILKGKINYDNIHKDTHYRKLLKSKYEFEFAYSLDEIKNKVIQYAKP